MNNNRTGDSFFLSEKNAKKEIEESSEKEKLNEDILFICNNIKNERTTKKRNE